MSKINCAMPQALIAAADSPAPPSIATKLTRWTYSIDDVDGNGEAGTTFTCTDLLETKVAAYYAMCAVFDGPIPEVEEEDKQYVPPPTWEEEDGIYVWDVYSDGTFTVRVFPRTTISK